MASVGEPTDSGRWGIVQIDEEGGEQPLLPIDSSQGNLRVVFETDSLLQLRLRAGDIAWVRERSECALCRVEWSQAHGDTEDPFVDIHSAVHGRFRRLELYFNGYDTVL